MLLAADHVRLMARYNAWQNAQIMRAVDGVSRTVLTEDHGAFFGSILGTLNHVLWADRLWLHRFGAKVAAPEGRMAESTTLTPTGAAWGAERFATDGALRLWARGLHSLDLTGDLTWFSAVKGVEVSRPRAMCVTHFFNHQTHHRGQVHAMLTRAGLPAPVTDLVFMPEEAL
ncbi:DinB family protein [Roseovarius sp. 217]|uniref:DinB family protein n=1 Tax=Roseovarius sp. (strain 217) TaxID=314264 RepID=UPI0000685CB1|nr:DinB family protein [Roseovarius sp. 217]EAQ26388.1 DinB family protein [Roseovarius sp. 217]